MTIKFVIAGNIKEYYEYWDKLPPEDQILSEYIHSPHTIKSEMNPSGVFIGTYKDRKDIWDIIIELIQMSTDQSKIDRLNEIAVIVAEYKRKQL